MSPDGEMYAEQWTAAADLFRSHAAKCDEQAKASPPVPRLRREGALMGCGCWWAALPGSSAGYTKAICPLHGETLMERANVKEPLNRWVPING